MQTGENLHALRKIIDFTRLMSMAVLAVHFYLCCYGAFKEAHLTSVWGDHFLSILSRLPIFKTNSAAKFTALALLVVSLIGVKGRKDDKIEKSGVIAYLLTGLLLYFISGLILLWMAPLKWVAAFYTGITFTGYLLILTGGSRLSRLIKLNLMKDIFNRENESFPQEQRKLENEYSVNLPAEYHFKGKQHPSWINIINPFRGTLVLGSPGAGKSYFVIRHIIEQHIRKGFSMFIYDFKFDDLSRIAYNALLKYAKNYKVKPTFYVIDFDRILHRCNPLLPHTMLDITDATESARTFMLGLNREWIRRQGDFFVESPITFITALIWYLKKHKGGRYCTLPHVIELAQVDYLFLFSVLQKEPEIAVLINPFISAWLNEATDQLEGQVASAKISLARLSSPQLYYVLSGNDFSLDLNNPDEPKIICMGNNPQKQQVYGAVLSLYISRMIKLVNQRDKQKCSLVFDEFPTIYFNNIDYLVATARSNKVATTLAAQDYSQLKKDYGREQAEVIMNIIGNVISGQVTGDTAKQLSERFGKIMQQRESVSINSQDTSISRSTQLDYAIPASKIAGLSSGEFVGMVADDPDNKIDLKVFHSEIRNDHEAIKKETATYQPIPQVRNVSQEAIQSNYMQIKEDIEYLVREELGSL
jgi:hypothetical protein